MTPTTTGTAHVPADELRARFAAAMSAMYAAEVPLYADLLHLVREVNGEVLAASPPPPDIARLNEERHGAIRLGTAGEMRRIARAFAVLGMAPVGYYDLAPAGLPIHATAFRPITAAGLAASPFRIFTSLLRLDLIEPPSLRHEARTLLARRAIMTGDAERLLDQAGNAGGLGDRDAERFVAELIETFRWHGEAGVSAELYRALAASHRLVADIVGFRGPHINHLTPRVLDIDKARARMAERSFAPKETIEGPPPRAFPVLLRQTSFKALEEPIVFRDARGAARAGLHGARFGEIEQRGAALTRAGRARYDRWIAEGGDLSAHLPDDAATLRREGLACFRYDVTEAGRRAAGAKGLGAKGSDASIDRLIGEGLLAATPILYEDFLPVSAAGIFRSNLGGQGAAPDDIPAGDRRALERAIGSPIHDEFGLYAKEEAGSLARAGVDEVARPAPAGREWVSLSLSK